MEMRARAVSVGVLASMVGLALLAPSAPAAPGTIKGTVAGPGTPDAGEGITAIRAVNAETGAIGATDYTAGRHDRWNLSVKPGPYAVGLATISFSGGRVHRPPARLRRCEVARNRKAGTEAEAPATGPRRRDDPSAIRARHVRHRGRFRPPPGDLDQTMGHSVVESRLAAS